MLKIVIDLLRKAANDLEDGTTHLDSEGCYKVLNFINLMQNGDQEMSKSEAAEYVGVCRATFDNYVKDGFIPEGRKHEGTKALFWWKSDLDAYLYKKER